MIHTTRTDNGSQDALQINPAKGILAQNLGSKKEPQPCIIVTDIDTCDLDGYALDINAYETLNRDAHPKVTEIITDKNKSLSVKKSTYPNLLSCFLKSWNLDSFPY